MLLRLKCSFQYLFTHSFIFEFKALVHLLIIFIEKLRLKIKKKKKNLITKLINFIMIKTFELN